MHLLSLDHHTALDFLSIDTVDEPEEHLVSVAAIKLLVVRVVRI